MQLTDKEKLARSKVCLPLDGLNSIESIKERVDELSPFVGLFKIGKELYTRFGPTIVELVHEHGADVFLDLKYHDIPNTVRGAAKAATELGVYMFNVHASGGYEMLKAAKEGAQEALSFNSNLKKPVIIAVTVLTSIDDKILNNQLNIRLNVEEQVLCLAKLTEQAGLDGIVCSAADLRAVRNKLPDNFLYVTPGIKGPQTSAGSDQKRVFTPGNALKDGASILVIGRAITEQPTREKRIEAVLSILKDMSQTL